MIRTKVLCSNGSQAVRLPAEVAFPADVRDVAVIRDGVRRIIVPADRTWDDFFAGSGFELGNRRQPTAQERHCF